MEILKFSFVFDKLSLSMAMLALFMAIAISIFSLDYVEKKRGKERRFFVLSPWMFCVFSCMALFSGDWFFFGVFLEMSSIMLFFMILPLNFRTALYYLLTQLSGSLLIFVGAAIMITERGSAVMGPVPPNLLWLFLSGLGIKTALLGLHFWLPKVHSEAPTPTSALLSGFSVKLGIYGLIRLASLPATDVLMVLGPSMALYGIIQAITQHDAKRLLAYHTISQLGYIVSAIGVGTALGIVAGVYHTVAHALFKGLLFLCIGSIEKAYGTRDLSLWGHGTARAFPVTFAFFLIGALAISGFPGMSGFASKAMIKASLKEISFYPVVWILQAANVGTVLSFFKLGYYGFFFKGDVVRKDPHYNPILSCKKRIFQNTGMALLAFMTIFLGICPQLLPNFMGMNFGNFFETEALLSAIIPIFTGGILFIVFKKTLTPGKHEIYDLDFLLIKLYGILILCPTIVAKIHTGKLRQYTIHVIIAALVIFFFLART
ncbi:multicomponent Na+:H+ antiporter subunit D [Acetomicrobium thermoterrenum DSM 13490]|uniref:Multicomponent Na+:H+ antiporter subunit D n=1 Tax=Acetomicrobium thermoterrenum DSM 13490 TaxID=1120987 RepID=A0A1H3GDQ5_9BACT|nr:proton-conducting transporter membrane subunit [Acetomicrobium thermoterrenum]SDY01411.1 multicomponent Na+:H+ antiporter subunit D [Acetomicrobium thermoterrenum DSM 13490]